MACVILTVGSRLSHDNNNVRTVIIVFTWLGLSLLVLYVFIYVIKKLLDILRGIHSE